MVGFVCQWVVQISHLSLQESRQRTVPHNLAAAAKMHPKDAGPGWAFKRPAKTVNAAC